MTLVIVFTNGKCNTSQGKFEEISFNSNTYFSKTPKLILSGKSLQYVNESCVLGLTIEENLSWNSHVNKVKSLTLSSLVYSI